MLCDRAAFLYNGLELAHNPQPHRGKELVTE